MIITENLVNLGRINAFTSDKDNYIQCTKDWKILIRINVSNPVTINKIVLTSNNLGVNYNVGLG